MAYTYSTDSVAYSAKTFTFTSNVISYNAVSKIATLDRPIDVSLGYNFKLGDISSTYNIIGNVDNLSSAISGNVAAPTLSTDESGKYVGIFNVPEGRFQIGQRIFRLDNRLVPGFPETATTYAEATFYSIGLQGKLSKTEYSPSFDSSGLPFFQSSEYQKTISVYTPHDPIAQTFSIPKNNFPNGTFISSIKLFFATKPMDNIPIKLSIVGTNNGVPGGNILDYSRVILDASQVVTSNTPHYLDSTTYTEFVFDAPVYIKPDQLYAMLLESNSSDYNLYVAKQNENAIPSSTKVNPTDPTPTVVTKIGTIPYIGNLFETQNSQTWVPLQTTDLMFVINNCQFSVNPVGSSVSFIIPKNQKTRKFVGQELVQYKIDANSINSIYDTFNETIPASEYNITTTDFIPGSTSLYYNYQTLYGDKNLPQQSSTKIVTPGKYGLPTPTNIPLDDGNGPRWIIPGREDSIILNAQMNSKDKYVSPIISDDGITAYTINYFINDMGISNNIISVINGGSNYNAQTTYATISSSDYGTKPNLGVYMANGVIQGVYVKDGDSSGSGYIKTPTITIVDANTTPGTGAVISVSGETSASGGNALCRYITKKVTLTPENDSGDLRVFLTAYWPYGSNIFVYYKILNRNDNQRFEDQYWQLMTLVTNVNTYAAARDELIEYEFAPGKLNVADDFVSYTSTNGTVYNSFSQFAIKIVMATIDNTVIPYVNDLRALALPSGTGI